MKRYLLQAGHWSAYLFLLLILMSLQSSLWPLLLGPFPPLFWIVPFLYIGVYFPTLRAFFYVFSLALILSFASSAAPFIFIFSLGILTGLMTYFRRHIFWPGPTYFMLSVLMATLCYPLLVWIASLLVEPQPMRHPSLMSWSFQVLLTPWLAFPVYRILGAIDKFILPEGIFRETGVSAQ